MDVRNRGRRSRSGRIRDLTRMVDELCATAEALGLILDRFGRPTLELALDIVCDAEHAARATQVKCAELTRELRRCPLPDGGRSTPDRPCCGRHTAPPRRAWIGTRRRARFKLR